ncbi:hypothetical protein IAU59_005618 [Kwoniella sp. CBS 9459]
MVSAYTLLVPLVIVRAAYAALSVGCYTQAARHQQYSSSPDLWDTECISFCGGYFPDRSYAYWWQEYLMSEGYVHFCWCTNHRPEAQFREANAAGDCATNFPFDIVTRISVYLIKPIDGWTDVAWQYLDPDPEILSHVTYLQNVPQCLEHCKDHIYATWLYDLYYHSEHENEVSCRCFDTVHWSGNEAEEYRDRAWIYRHSVTSA